MKRTIGLLLVICSAGCLSYSTVDDDDGGVPKPAFAVADDGTTLTFKACEVVGDQGCIETAAPMTVAINGVAYPVPMLAPAFDFNYELDLPSPIAAVDHFEVSFGTYSRVFDAIPAFAVTGPSAVVRSTQPMPIDLAFSLAHEATADASAQTICTGAPGYPYVEITNDVAFLTLGDNVGTCTHEVTVTQYTDDYGDNSTSYLDMSHTTTFTLTSTP